MPTDDFPTDPKVDALIERYPRLFKGAPTYAWSDLPQGWTELADRLFADMDRMLDDWAAARFEVHQIKEKFAGLRVSWRLAEAATDGVDGDAFDDLVPKSVEPSLLFTQIKARVAAAQEEAAKTCQKCGNGSATANRSGYMVTLCDYCRTQSLRKVY